MKKLMLVLVALWGTTARADFNSALDCQGLTFTTGGDAEWVEQSSVVKEGVSALRSGDLSDSQSYWTWLETTVSGSGTLSFWWKVSSEYDSDFVDLSVEVDDHQKAKIFGRGGDWTLKSVAVFGDGAHIIRWMYKKHYTLAPSDDGGGLDDYVGRGDHCGWLDAVSWTPAPESMTIAFETNGGEELDPEIVTPGTTYGELPVPDHDTMFFIGWYLDAALTLKASDDDIIPFVNATLYAKWGIPVESMDTEDISFSTDGGWCVEEGTGQNGEDSIVSYANGTYWNGINGLCANVTGAGTLAFKFKGTYEYYYWHCYLSVNGNYEPMSTLYRNGEWQDCAIIIRGEPNNVQSIEWYAEDGKTALSDFVWTPAPETTTIAFETNGAGNFDSIVLASSNVVQYLDILPTISREGYVFVGWYLDPGFTERLDEDQIVGFDNVTLYAKWELSVEVLNTDDMKFSAPEGSCWYARESSDANGGYAATRWKSNQWVEDSFLKVNTVGYGTLSLNAAAMGWELVRIQYAINGEDVQDYHGKGFFYLDGDGVRSVDNLALQVVPDSATATNEIAFGINSWDEVNDTLYNFTWTPAPESMTVSFDSAGGGNVAPRIYAPGDAYGELPVPARNGCTFLGWVNGNVLGGVAVREDDFVPFNDVTLVTKWAANEFTALPAAFTDVAFWPQESSVRQIVAADGSSVVEVAFDFGDEMFAMSEMTAKTTCAGYLSFEVGVPLQGSIVPPVVSIDDKTVTVREEKVEMNLDVVWTRYHVAIPEGQHDISWWFEAYLYLGWQSFALIRNVEFEPIVPQKDVFAWIDKIIDYRSWITNDLGRFAQSYATRFAEDETDYEARLLHAATILAQLGENEAVARYAAQFGYSIDYLGLTVSTNGARDVSSWPGVNGVVDEAFSVALPVIETALADVSAIPLDWAGSIRLAAEKYHLDEDVYLDLGDVMAVRAALESAIGLLHFTKGYDWTVDYESANATLAEIDANQRVYRMITEQTNFMARVRNQGSLGTSKTWMTSALQRALDAAAFMRARPAEGEMHFFEYDPELAAEWEQATNLVSKALASLDGAQEVDIAEEVIGCYGSCDTSLLPNDGVVRIYLGALFSGRITQDLRPAVNLDGEGKAVADFATMKDPTIANLLPEFTSETWSVVHSATTNYTHVFSKEAIPEVIDDAGVAIALKGSKDPELKKNIVDAGTYESYREWAQTVSAMNSTAAAGMRAVKGSANAWLSYALGLDVLVDKELESAEVKIESFSPASADGKFDFTVSVQGLNIGGGSVEGSVLKANLKKVLGVEGSKTLSPAAFSSDNIDIDIGTPVDGKAKLTVTPPVDAGDTFFMRVKVK